MTSYGIQSIGNANGDVLIDQDYRCLEIVAEGTITAPGAGINFIHTISVPSGFARPMFLLELTLNSKYVMGIPTATEFKFTTNHTSGQTFGWKIAAARAGGSAGGGHGAAAFDADGNCVFSTNRKYARLRTALTPPDYGNSAEFLIGGSGLPFGFRYTHTSKPIPFGTFWHAGPVPVLAGGSANRKRPWAMRRLNTTQLQFSWDGDEEMWVDPTSNALGYGSLGGGFFDSADVQAWLIANS